MRNTSQLRKIKSGLPASLDFLTYNSSQKDEKLCTAFILSRIKLGSSEAIETVFLSLRHHMQHSLSHQTLSY